MSQLVHEFLTENVAKYGDNPVLSDREQTITHKELDEQSNRVANWLIEFGIEKGDRVGLIMDTSVVATVVVFGIMKTGAIYVPINPMSASDFVEQVLVDTEVKLLFVDEKHLNKTNVSYVYTYKPTIIANYLKGNDRQLQGTTQCCALEQMQSYPTALISSAPNIISNDIVCIIYTSGTTGKPKGIMCKHGNITPFMTYIVETFTHDESSKSMSRSPISFDPYLTEIVPSLMSGGKVYFYSFTTLNAFLKVIEREKIKDLRVLTKV